MWVLGFLFNHVGFRFSSFIEATPFAFICSTKERRGIKSTRNTILEISSCEGKARNNVNSQLYMLEGAKSIGAGAATIALAGAAVGIGNGMPTKNQLISFANECNGVAYCLYFLFLISFFFLSYFFPMTTRNGQIKNFISNSSSFFYFFIFKYPSLLLFIKVTILVVLVFYRFLLPLVLLVSHLDLGSSFFLITLPPEVQNPQALAHLEGLNFYLSFYDQDPEWVAFIQQELNHNTPLEDIPGRLRLFLMEEKISCLRRDLFQDFIFQYNNSSGVLPLEPYILEEAVRSYLDKGMDNLSILRAAYQDLRENGEGSIFFLEVVSHNQDYLDAQTTSRRCHELAQRIRWDGIARSRAQLERAEYEHALLLFQYEDLKRGRGHI